MLKRLSVLCLVVSGVISLWSVAVHGQQLFQVYIAAMDAKGMPVTDLKPEDVLMMEAGAAGRIVRLERFSWPVKVTVLVDNGPTTQDALAHYRTGLRRFFDALPPDIEVSLIATAPNPRWLARRTMDPVQIRKGVDLLTSDEGFARSNDAFVEYAERLDADFKNLSAEQPRPYLPVLLSIGSNGRDGSTVMRDPLMKMLNSLVRHRVMVNIAMLSIGGAAGLNDGTHVFVAKAAQELTKGRYEALAASSRLTTLLPEMGQQIAATHVKQTTQYRVTLERPAGASGPLRDLRISIGREGLKYIVTADGRIM